VSNPASPVPLGRHAGGVSVGSVAGGYAYAAGDGGLQVIEVSDPANPQRVGEYAISNGSAFSVQTVGAYAYVADLFEGLHIINVSNWPADTLGCRSSTSATGRIRSGWANMRMFMPRT
jgi:hypothetical protein